VRKLSLDETVWINMGWQPTYIGFCPSEKAWHKMIKKFGIPVKPYPTSSGTTTTFHDVKGVGDCVVVTIAEVDEDRHSPLQIQALMVHECVHVFQQCHEIMGGEPPSEEYEAYGIQNIFQDMMEVFNQVRPRKNAENN
jgi:hypothetical protein